MANPKNIEKHRFKKGQSGNPKGRPKLPDVTEALSKMWQDDKTGKNGVERLLLVLQKRAEQGDVKAAQILLERGYGKPKDNEGQPTEMIIRVQRRS